MSIATPKAPSDALDVILDLSRLSPGELDDRSVAGRILSAVERVLPGSEPRVGIARGDRLVGFSGATRLDAPVPQQWGPVETGPLVDQWLRSSANPDVDALAAPLRAALGLLRNDLRVAVLRCGDVPIGYVASAPPRDADAPGEVLEDVARAASVVVENARLYRRLELEAETDGLTGALNYRTFMRTVENEMDRVRRHGGELAVVMVDVDNLKEYNDAFGHLGGSAALREIAAIIRKASRATDVVAKYGGDEFSILLPQCDRDGARGFGERIRERVAAHSFEDDAARHLTVSLGVASFPSEGDDPKDLLRRADARLYDAKRGGRNRLVG